MSYSVNSRFYAMLFPILSSTKPGPGFQLGSTNVVVWRHQWSKSRANQEWFFKCCPDTLMKLRMTLRKEVMMIKKEAVCLYILNQKKIRPELQQNVNPRLKVNCLFKNCKSTFFSSESMTILCRWYMSKRKKVLYCEIFYSCTCTSWVLLYFSELIAYFKSWSDYFLIILSSILYFLTEQQ